MHQRGFSLLEMSVVLLIVGSMTGGMLVMANKKVEQNKYDITQDHLQLIDQTLTAYATRGHILPCPASSDAALNSATFGVADNCAAAAPALSGIIADDAGTADEVWIGVVPTRALDLPDSVMFDGWGNRIRYAVVKSLASSVDEFENFTTTVSGMTAGLQVKDGYGNSLTSVTGLNVAAYALVSFGKDKVGARPRTGTSIPVACPSSSAVKSEENCDDDSLFIDATYNDGTVAASYFDDLVRWKSWYRIAPVEKPELPPFVPNIISVGQAGGCAVNDQALLMCWGTNQFGTLGQNHKNYAYSIPQPAGTAGTATNFTDWEKVSVAGRTVCGIRNGGELWCWGRNGMAATGNGTGSGYPCNETSGCAEHVVIPTRIGAASDWVSASPGGGIRSDGRAYGWGNCPGDNATSCAGDDSFFNNATNTFVSKVPAEIHTDFTSATPNATFTDWVDLARGGRGGCGLRANGEIWCWGLNAQGQVGDGTIDDPIAAPIQRRGVVPISGGCQGNFSSVYSGGSFSCGICRTGEAYCWGSNTQGQLGAGKAPWCAVSGGCTTSSNQWQSSAPQPDWPVTPYYESIPFNPLTNTTTNPVTQTASSTATIPAGYFYLTPQLVSGGMSWSTLTLAGETACGITTSGHAYCWGDNSNAVFGAPGNDSNVPKEVAGAYSDWLDVGTGQKEICGSRADKKLYCWGDGWYCDLGAGEPTANPATNMADSVAKCADHSSPNAVYNLTLPF